MRSSTEATPQTLVTVGLARRGDDLDGRVMDLGRGTSTRLLRGNYRKGAVVDFGGLGYRLQQQSAVVVKSLDSAI